MSSRQREAVSILEGYKKALIRKGEDGTAKYTAWADAAVNAKLHDDELADKAILLVRFYEAYAEILRKTASASMNLAKILGVESWQMLGLDTYTAEAWRRVAEEEYPSYSDLVLVGLSAASVARELDKLEAQAEAEEEAERNAEYRKERESNIEFVREYTGSTDLVASMENMSDAEVHRLAKVYRDEWRLQNNAERMEDIA